MEDYNLLIDVSPPPSVEKSNSFQEINTSSENNPFDAVFKQSQKFSTQPMKLLSTILQVDDDIKNITFNNVRYKETINKEASKILTELSHCADVCSEEFEEYECGFLDSTPQPSFEELSDIETDLHKPIDTEAVFKALDKILPNNVNKTNKEESKEILNALGNPSEVTVDKSIIITQQQVTSDRNSNAEIINKKQLILQISSIIQKSSITTENVKSFKHDLVTSIASILQVTPPKQPLNNLKSNINKNSTEENKIALEELQQVSTAEVGTQNNSNKKDASIYKFKPKKNNDNAGIAKKGPMKAIIPLEDIAKNVPIKVSKDSGQKTKKIVRRSSVRQPPVAQSTPERVTAFTENIQQNNSSSTFTRTRSLNDISPDNLETTQTSSINNNSSIKLSKQLTETSREISSSYIDGRKSTSLKKTRSFGSSSHIERVRSLVNNKNAKSTARLSTSESVSVSKPKEHFNKFDRNSIDHIPSNENSSLSLRKRSDSFGYTPREKGLNSNTQKSSQGKSVLIDINNSIGFRSRSNSASKLFRHGSITNKENAGHKI